MKLETVGGVTVGNLGLQVGRQVDDVNGTEGAFLGTDTATDTEALGDEGNLGLGSDLDTQLTRTDDGARLLTFLATFLEEKGWSVRRLVWGREESRNIGRFAYLGFALLPAKRDVSVYVGASTHGCWQRMPRGIGNSLCHC